MAKRVRELETWDRTLAAGDFLTFTTWLVAQLEEQEQQSVPAMQAQVQLTDGAELVAKSVEELVSDLRDVQDREVTQIDLYLACSAASVHLYVGPWPGRDEQTRLNTSGGDEPYALGLHGLSKRRIAKLFEAQDAAKPAVADPVGGAGGIQIGPKAFISGGMAAVSASGRLASSPPVTSSSTSHEPAPHAKHSWWQQAWVTIAAPIIVIVVAAVIVALLLGH
jgi:hypothetical protein